jgi:hypothetical protein
MLAVTAGFCTEDRVWFTFAVLLEPVLFMGDSRHGRPIDLALGAILHPLLAPLLAYMLLWNVGPLILVYGLLIAAGRWASKKMRFR